MFMRASASLAMLSVLGVVAEYLSRTHLLIHSLYFCLSMSKALFGPEFGGGGV